MSPRGSERRMIILGSRRAIRRNSSGNTSTAATRKITSNDQGPVADSLRCLEVRLLNGAMSAELLHKSSPASAIPISTTLPPSGFGAATCRRWNAYVPAWSTERVSLRRACSPAQQAGLLLASEYNSSAPAATTLGVEHSRSLLTDSRNETAYSISVDAATTPPAAFDLGSRDLQTNITRTKMPAYLHHGVLEIGEKSKIG